MRHNIFRFMLFFAFFTLGLAVTHILLVTESSVTGFASYQPKDVLLSTPIIGIFLVLIIIVLAFVVKPKKPKHFPRYLRIHSHKGSFK